ncbi:Putative Ca2+/H+ antiporter, TMEM165/GDT1 family [Pseudomonas linyingensis]|jgi:putative Ca2+/H+ antiporter (TMEM165/GDT1 family)|uniref:GDT1 family protein n=1 Tax=Pseudomonas linyingensis TaxID=915471 RepID=A0A1H6U6U1_9PSED|nr:Putative Ca2+/H+ antiporter, TMEM165/GDT1 family [Pseudomonas linyingensis]
MEALQSLFVPTGLVALAEIGDKTQLLALLLAARFRRPWPIIWGILVATVANHFAAGAVGKWVASFFSEATLSWILAASFLAVAAWMLIPDKLDDDEESHLKRYGPFLTTLIAFFIAEMGDKTQIATVMLAAQYEYFWLVIAGTTLGMMIANVPVVLAAHFSADKLPMTLIHRVSALCFVALALYAAWNAAKLSGWLG